MAGSSVFRRDGSTGTKGDNYHGKGRARSGLKLLVAFDAEQPYRARFPFAAMATSWADDVMAGNVAQRLREALASRVEKYFGEFFDSATSPDLSENFLAIVRDLRTNPKREKNWLALTFLLGQLPTGEQVTKLEMWIRSSRDDQELVENILGELAISLARSGALTDVLVVKERVIVLLKDVAKQSLHTGVQRVTRDLCLQLIDIDQTIVFANI
jgi:hypothetical protein